MHSLAAHLRSWSRFSLCQGTLVIRTTLEAVMSHAGNNLKRMFPFSNSRGQTCAVGVFTFFFNQREGSSNFRPHFVLRSQSIINVDMGRKDRCSVMKYSSNRRKAKSGQQSSYLLNIPMQHDSKLSYRPSTTLTLLYSIDVEKC